MEGLLDSKRKAVNGMLETLLLGLALYGAIGVAFAVPFLWWGASRIDPAAARGTVPFRVLILPGVVAFWPFLLLRWLRAPSEEA